ncbi:MAG: primosomal protein N' [Pseudomonadota bacterium]|nr:primosomal protein N' [Pseudomonadota bacterium]
MKETFYKVGVDAPLDEGLTYSYSGELSIGQSVIVPLGSRKVTGIILGLAADHSSSKFKVKSILEAHSEWPILKPKLLEWLVWLSRYYQYPVGQVASLSFPPLSKNTKRKTSKAPLIDPKILKTKKHPLTAEQTMCFNKISATSGFGVHLLFGVTGSGKTEVYLELFEEVLRAGKQGMFLVPEIALTPQLVNRFAARFGNAIGVIHSHLTEREKTTQWWEMCEGKKQILIGARSALFCPLPNLGLIVVDEEHEQSFKQDEKLRYHARDAAVMLAKLFDIPVVLGSATPSMETWHNAMTGKYQIHEMKYRVENRSMPTIEIVDLKKPTPESELPFWLSPTLYEQLKKNLSRGEQSALFLNRRGTAQLVLCPGCGFTSQCPNCAVSLTLHGKKHLVCHYCDYSETLKEKCSECKIGELKSIGLGTEKIEEDIASLFPTARLARADRDEIQNREQLEEFIKDIEDHKTDIIIGTQMIAKGLDFQKLTLVGVVLADIGFNMPDFRASERSFQLITQVSGRSGRHISADKLPGRVIIQTFNPEHLSLNFAIKNDYRGFANQELSFREKLGYPPFGRLAAFRIKGIDKAQALESAQKLSSLANALKKKYENFSKVEVLGPAEAPLAKLHGQYRYQLLVKAQQANHLNQFCQVLVVQKNIGDSKVKVQVDIDPLNLL